MAQMDNKERKIPTSEEITNRIEEYSRSVVGGETLSEEEVNKRIADILNKNDDNIRKMEENPHTQRKHTDFRRIILAAAAAAILIAATVTVSFATDTGVQVRESVASFVQEKIVKPIKKTIEKAESTTQTATKGTTQAETKKETEKTETTETTKNNRPGSIEMTELVKILAKHGFENIVFPDRFMTGEAKVRNVRFRDSDEILRIRCDILLDGCNYETRLEQYASPEQVPVDMSLNLVEYIREISVSGVPVYVSYRESGKTSLRYGIGKSLFYFKGFEEYSEVMEIAESINFGSQAPEMSGENLKDELAKRGFEKAVLPVGLTGADTKLIKAEYVTDKLGQTAELNLLKNEKRYKAVVKLGDEETEKGTDAEPVYINEEFPLVSIYSLPEGMVTVEYGFTGGTVCLTAEETTEEALKIFTQEQQEPEEERSEGEDPSEAETTAQEMTEAVTEQEPVTEQTESTTSVLLAEEQESK